MSDYTVLSHTTPDFSGLDAAFEAAMHEPASLGKELAYDDLQRAIAYMNQPEPPYEPMPGITVLENGQKIRYSHLLSCAAHDGACVEEREQAVDPDALKQVEAMARSYHVVLTPMQVVQMLTLVPSH